MNRILLSIIALSISINCFSQEKLSTTQVNIFKNGTYFIVKEGKVKPKDGLVRLDIPSQMLLSTFWLTTLKGVDVDRMVVLNDTIKIKQSYRSYEDLLRLNIGKTMTITYRLPDNKTELITGKLENFNSMVNIAEVTKGDREIAFIPSSKIESISIEKSSSINRSVDADSIARMANVYLKKHTGETQFKLSYMQPGIQWIPMYNVKVIDDKELQLEMKAVIENFGESIDNADVTLTVGDPNFRYGRNVDPIATLYSSGNQGYQQQYYQPVYQYANTLSATYSGDAEYSVATSPEPVNYQDYNTYETTGEKSNDLYMYQLGELTLPMNSKTSVNIFSAKVPYEDVYEVKIADVTNYASTYYINKDQENKFDVIHSYKLKNTTTFPFTTGAAFVQNEKLMPLAQDDIRYTPVGAKVSVNLSKSVDIQVKNEEDEISKSSKSKQISNYYYDLVTIKGTITVKNLQAKDIKINIDKSVTGEITEVSDSGTFKKPGKYNNMNPYSTAKWEIAIKAGETKKITYVYSVYISTR